MEESTAGVQTTLRTLRILHAGLLVSMALYAAILRLVPAQTSQPASSLLLTTAGALAVIVLGVGFVARLSYLQPALETLRSNPEDAGALTRWRAVSILSAVLAESAALFGVVIHFVGGRDAQSYSFIVASAVVMLLWWPRQP